jgi:hypothetical protein
MDALALLRDVKAAEEEKARAVAEARAIADALVRKAEAAMAAVDASVRRDLEMAEPKLRAEMETAVGLELGVMDRRVEAKQVRLQEAAGKNFDEALREAKRAFLEAWSRKGIDHAQK